MTPYVCYLLLTRQVPVLYVYAHDPKLVITVPADVLAPNGARASAGIVLITS